LTTPEAFGPPGARPLRRARVSTDEADGWLAYLRRRDKRGRLLLAALFFITSARQP